MPLCTAACGGSIVIPTLDSLCDVALRSECISKLLFFTCPTAIPSGSDAAKGTALAALITSGDLGATGRLRNVTLADPATTDFATSDCAPALPIVTQRDLTFEDLNAIDGTDASPTPYFDRDFWNTIISSGQKFNFGYTTCDGKMYLYTQDRAQTKFMTGIIQVIETFDRTLANRCTELKKGTIRFLGDPKAFFPKPYLDLSLLVGTTPSLLGLY